MRVLRSVPGAWSADGSRDLACVRRAAVNREPAVADHEFNPVSLSAEVNQEVASLLGGPFPGWMKGDSEDADAPGGVLDHGQDMGLGAVE